MRPGTWVRLATGLALCLAALFLARRTIVTCAQASGVCRYGEQRIVGGDVREVRIDEIERIALDRIMNREGERRSQAIFLMKSGARIPATAMDEREKTEIVTSFAALQAGERASFDDTHEGVAAYAAAAMGVLGLAFLAVFAVRLRREVTSSK